MPPLAQHSMTRSRAGDTWDGGRHLETERGTMVVATAREQTVERRLLCTLDSNVGGWQVAGTVEYEQTPGPSDRCISNAFSHPDSLVV